MIVYGHNRKVVAAPVTFDGEEIAAVRNDPAYGP
jgi:hypothetical protein